MSINLPNSKPTLLSACTPMLCIEVLCIEVLCIEVLCIDMLVSNTHFCHSKFVLLCARMSLPTL